VSKADAELADKLEKEYLTQVHFGSSTQAQAANDKHASRLLNAYENQLNKPEGDGNDSEEDEDVKKMEEKAIEEFLADSKNNNYGQISEEYKLFELVCAEEPK